VTVGTWVLVGLLGGAGAVSRFLIDALVSERVTMGAFPWGTLVVNLSGAALLGGLVGAAVAGRALLLAGTATLGSYTTLSTWMLETHRLGQDNQLLGAAINLVGSLVMGFGSVAAGHAVGAAL
jgi:fluoride exporter